MIVENPPKTYHSKNTRIFSCQYHVIFCPKYRRPILVNDIAKTVEKEIRNGEKRGHYQIIAMEIMPDHIHLLLDVDPDFGINSALKWIKGRTASVLNKRFPELRKRLPCIWTRSKFICSVGAVSLDSIKHYIERQKGK